MKVLIADDDPSLRFLCRAALESYGHEVALAEDGSEVLSYVSDNTPDLLLLDVSMPYVGGLEVLNRMPSRMRDTLPVILLSARVRIDERIEGLEAGAIDYVTKPFQPADLVRVANEVHAMSPEARRRYRISLIERLRGDQLRSSLKEIDGAIDLRDRTQDVFVSRPKDEYSRRAARRQTAVASLALSAVTGVGTIQLIDEMIFTVADVLALARVAFLEVKSDGRLICRSVGGKGSATVLPGMTVAGEIAARFLSNSDPILTVSSAGVLKGEGEDDAQTLELWVAVPGCSGRLGAVVMQHERSKSLDVDDLRFVEVSAGIVSASFYSMTARTQRDRSFASPPPREQ